MIKLISYLVFCNLLYVNFALLVNADANKNCQKLINGSDYHHHVHKLEKRGFYDFVSDPVPVQIPVPEPETIHGYGGFSYGGKVRHTKKFRKVGFNNYGNRNKYGNNYGNNYGHKNPVPIPDKISKFEEPVVKEQYTKCHTTEGISGVCRNPSYCYFQYDDAQQYAANLCKQLDGLIGICCPLDVIRVPALPPVPIVIPRIQKFNAPIPRISLEDINEAAETSREIIKEQFELERQLVRKGYFQRHDSAEARHQSFFGGPTEENRKIAMDGLIALETAIQLSKKFRLTPQQARDGLSRYSLYETSVAEHCLIEPKCYRSKYRTLDGSCNNLKYPLWGRSLTPFIRLLPPAYFDGLNELRRSVDGSELPSARAATSRLALDFDLPDKKNTLIVMQWGQFLDHDLTLTASTRLDTGEGITCCEEEFARNPDIMHPACKPIRIPDNDPFYSRHNSHCINFVRNAPSPTHRCKLGPREQTNQLTHYLDGSMVYGSTDKRAQFLRLKRGGLLRFEIINNVEYLPFDTHNKSDECAIPEERRLQCFVGGDVRVNEQTGLTILHMLLLREHNRIAKVLAKINPQWNDEILYQEARRIVWAEIQHISNNEWLPIILGRKVMQKFGLFLKPSGFWYDYDPKLNPGIINSFATSAYRFHTLIQGQYKLMTNQGRVTEILMLRNLFNNPESIYRPGAFDEFLNALTGQPVQTFDQFFSEELTNHLFQEHNRSFGMDLIALNLQRAREHGLPGYNAYRKVCGLPGLNSFQDLYHVMREGSAEIFAKVYKHVDDIDLFVGSNHERALPGAFVGPTIACIIAEQQRRNKFADRFWYEIGGQPHSFTEAQLNEIRKSSMAGLVCHNSDNIHEIQPLAFFQEAPWNQRIPCKNIPTPDLLLWKNEPVF